MELERILKNTYAIIDSYESGDWHSSQNLRVLLRDLSVNYTWITRENIEAYREWNKSVYFREDKTSVAAAKIKADEDVPALRLTRKLLQAVDHVIWSMRAELSIIKKE